MKKNQKLFLIYFIVSIISIFNIESQNIDIITPDNLSKGTKYSIDVHTGFQLNSNISKTSNFSAGIRKGIDFLITHNSILIFGAGFEKIDYNTDKENYTDLFFAKVGVNQPIFWEWLRVQMLLGGGIANGVMQNKKFNNTFAFNLQMMFNIRLGKHFSVWTSPVALDQATFIVGNNMDKGFSLGLGFFPLGLRYTF